MFERSNGRMGELPKEWRNGAERVKVRKAWRPEGGVSRMGEKWVSGQVEGVPAFGMIGNRGHFRGFGGEGTIKTKKKKTKKTKRKARRQNLRGKDIDARRC